MNTIGTYLLQMSSWLTAFWLVYTLVLKNETYFKLNRYFLLSGLIISIVIPMIPITYKAYQTVEPLEIFVIDNAPTSTEQSVSTINYWLLAYLFGVLFFIGRMLYQHAQLYSIRKRSISQSIGALKVFRIEKETAPFSFFNHIYVSSKTSNEVELNTIVAHEKVHIHERHWADLLLLEVVRTLQWFNPLMQLYRKAMMQNHEYLADSGTIERGVCARTYRAILANQMLGVPVVDFANSFTFRNSNNRILMMKKDKSNPIKRLKLLLIVPLMATIVMGFAKPKYVSENSMNAISAEKTIKIKGKVMDESGDPLPGASIIVSNTSYGTVSDMKGEFMLNAVKPSDNIVVSFVGYETIVSPAKNEMAFKMERNVVSIEVRKEKIAPPPPPPPPVIDIRGKDVKTPLIVIDGKIVNVEMSEIDPESIEKIEALKDETATIVYGDKGKDGVILITSKKKEPVRESPNGEVFIVVEDMPKYPGGKEALDQYIRDAASKVGLTGKADVTFTINAKGEVQNARVIRSTSDQLKQPALKIVNSMPKWKPGSQRGKPVKVSYSIVIEF